MKPPLKIIVDLQKSPTGDFEANLVALKKRIPAQYGAEAEVAWWVRPDQRQFLDAGDRVQMGPSDQADYGSAALLNAIREASQNGAAGSRFLVLTYNIEVIKGLTKLNSQDLDVAPLHLRSWLDEDARGPRSEEPRPAPSAGTATLISQPTKGISVPEAAGLLKRILREGGHNGPDKPFLQSHIRTEMEKRDSRAKKIIGDAVSENLIRLVLQTGFKEGWLDRAVPDPQGGKDVLWLKGAEAAPHHSPAGSHGPARGSLNAAPTAGGTTPVIDDKKFDRKWMEESLRSQRIWTATVPREHLLNATAAFFASESPALRFGEFITQIREMAENSYKANFPDKPMNWEVICNCYGRSLIEGGILLDETGQPLRTGIGVRSTPIKGVTPDFQPRCEALQVERILGQMPVGATEDHLCQIGLCLYQRGKENAVSKNLLLEKVDILLRLLMNEGRIRVEGDRIFAVRR